MPHIAFSALVSSDFICSDTFFEGSVRLLKFAVEKMLSLFDFLERPQNIIKFSDNQIGAALRFVEIVCPIRPRKSFAAS